MFNATESVEALKRQIAVKEKELEGLRNRLSNLEAHESKGTETEPNQQAILAKWPLLPEEYSRYGRQMIVPCFGIKGQLRLRSASVLIVGVGGLGCPAATYLAAAGIGNIGLVDGDTVDLSNLHRQIIHSSSTIGMNKVDSALHFLKRLNPHCRYDTYATHLTPQNAEEITSKYDLVLDCTDHPTSRYLISDISSILQKPLISASALRSDGQLLTLNWPSLPTGDENGGPCYRCVFPKPPPTGSVINCGEGGIIGPVVGVMGVLQALEAIKILSKGKILNSVDSEQKGAEPTMLIFSGNAGLQFRTVRLKGRRKDCMTCSDQAVVSLEKLRNGDMNYHLFCGIIPSPTAVLETKHRLQASQYAIQKNEGREHLLVDVREKVQFDICNLPGSINVPFSKFQQQCIRSLEDNEKPDWLPESLSLQAPIYIICRSGNDSQIVTKELIESGFHRSVKDVVGGFKAWTEQVDPSWPKY